MWYLDSGCLRHIIGDKKNFVNFKRKEQCYINKGKILGTSDIDGVETLEIKDVLIVEGLKHNLVRISQICDKGLKMIFESYYCIIHYKDSKEVSTKGKRYNNICLIYLDHASTRNITCLVFIEKNPWL